MRASAQVFVLVVGSVLLAACPDHGNPDSLWLTIGRSGLELLDKEPPAY